MRPQNQVIVQPSQSNNNQQNTSYSMPKKPQFYQNPQIQSFIHEKSPQNLNLMQQHINKVQIGNKHQNNIPQQPILQSSKSRLEYSNNVSLAQNNNKYKYQTPTSNSVQNINPTFKKSSYKEKPKKQNEYLITCRVLEAKLLVNLSKLFSMNVHCQIKFQNDIFKTNSQSGQNPKWNESFQFVYKDVTRKTQDQGNDEDNEDKIEFCLFHKPFLLSEEKIGETLFIVKDISAFNITDWFFLNNEQKQCVGSLLINITCEKKQESGVKKSPNVQEIEQNSIDLRNQEVSRSLAKNNLQKQLKKMGIKGPNNNPNPNQNIRGGPQMNGENQYIGLQTQQQQNSNAYLNTQANQPRQSVTEHSIIQLISTHSSNDVSQDDQHENETSERPHQQKKHKNKNKQLRQQNYQQNHIQTVEEDANNILPQQLFYGIHKNNNHSNSSNNLLIGGYQYQNPQQYSQYLAIEDLSNNFGQGGVGLVNQSQVMLMSKNKHHHHHHHHHKHNKEKRKKRKGKKDEEIKNNKDLQEIDEDDINYAQYLNQRSQQQLAYQNQKPISSSQSQQMFTQIPTSKNHLAFESGGGNSGSGSGGIQQLFSNGYFNLGDGSNGSYNLMANNANNIGGPSYFEEQHSIESLNNDQQQQILLTQGQYQLMNQQYELSEIQDVQQLRQELNEENYRQKAQEQKVIKLFQQAKQQMIKNKEKEQMLKKAKEQIKMAGRRVQEQQREIDYQRQQLEKWYIQIKKDKLRKSEELKKFEQMFSYFQELIQKGKLIQSNVGNNKIEDFINILKKIYFSLQQIQNTNNQEINEQIVPNLVQMNNQKPNSLHSSNSNSLGNAKFLLQDISAQFSKQQDNLYTQNNNFVYSLQQQVKDNQLKDQKFNSPPKQQITDIISNEEDDLLDGMGDIHQHNNHNKRQKIMDNQQFYLDQRELSTIVEREMTSQRRSSNEGRDIEEQFQPQYRSHNQQINNLEIEKNEIQLQKEMLRIKQQQLEQNLSKFSEERQLFTVQMNDFQKQQSNLEQMMQQLKMNKEEFESYKQQYSDVRKHNDKQNKNSFIQETTNKKGQHHIDFIGNQSQIQFQAQEDYNSEDQQNDDEDVDFYILNNLQKNQQEKEKIRQETGIDDPILLDQELIKNLKKQKQQKEIVHITASNGTSQQSFKGLQQTNENQNNYQYNDNVQEEEESLEFVPDPNFLQKLNQNIRQNDQNFENENKNMHIIQQQQIYNPLNFQNIDGNQDYQDDDEEEEEDQNKQNQNHYIGLNYYNENMQYVNHEDIQYVHNDDIQYDNNDGDLMDSPNVNVNQQIQQTNNERYNNNNHQNMNRHIVLDQHDMIDDHHEINQQQNNQGQGETYIDTLDFDYNTIRRDNDQQLQQIQSQQDIQEEIKQQIDNNIIIEQKKGSKLPEEEIIRLINEKYQFEETNKDVSIIYKNEKVYDQPKKAVYGIQKSSFNPVNIQ